MSLLSDLLARVTQPAPKWAPGAAPSTGPRLSDIVKGAYEAAKAPGKAYSEGMTTDEMIKAGNDFALNMGAGGSIVPKTPSSLGMFGGTLAKTANLNMLKSAERFEKAGASPDAIWKATGWGRGVDGQWRFEIPDNEAAFRPSTKKALLDAGLAQKDPGFNANDVFDHPALYDAYPGLAFNRVVPTWNAKGVSYGGKIGINPHPQYAESMDSTMLHELQHEIQHLEGFAAGSNPDAIRAQIQAALGDRLTSKHVSDLWELPNTKLYKATAGEVEARNVQKRQNFTPLQRAMRTPWSTEDIPRRSQLILGVGNE